MRSPILSSKWTPSLKLLHSSPCKNRFHDNNTKQNLTNLPLKWRKGPSFANFGSAVRSASSVLIVPSPTERNNSRRRRTLQLSSAWPSATLTWLHLLRVSMGSDASSVTFQEIFQISILKERLIRTCSTRTPSWCRRELTRSLTQK